MGKRKHSKKLSEYDNDYDDSASCASTSTMMSSLALGGSEEDLWEDDPFQQALDDLFEKRGATREKAYQTIVTLFEASVRIEDCLRNQDTLFSRCRNSMKKGGAAEAVLAARCMGLHALILGSEAESAVGGMLQDLMQAATHGKGPELKAAAAEALAMCTFVAVEDEEVALEVLATLRGCWKQESFRVKAAALRGWAFVLSSLNQRLVRSGQVDPAVTQLAALLHDGHVDVRKAAGEALALVHNAVGGGEEEEEEEGWGEEEEVEGGEGEGVVEEAMDRMQDLAKNRGDRQRRSKRERVALRSAFRDLCNVMQNGEVKPQKVKLQHGDCFVVDTLDTLVQLNYLRAFLAGGFQSHLQGNPLLHAVFSFTPLAERPERMSAAEKRAFRSPASFASKARSQDRKAQRSMKAAACW